MTTSYQYLQVTKGFGLCRINYAFPYGVKHAQIEWAFWDRNASPDANADADSFFAHWTTRMKLTYANEVTVTGAEVTLWDGATLQQSNHTYTPVAGTGGSGMVAPQVAAIVQKLTGNIGKENRGRIYLPGLPQESLEQPDSLGAATVATIQEAISEFVSDMEALSDISLMLIRKTEIPAKNYSIQLTTFAVENLVGTQRRRQRKAAHR